MLSAKLRRKIKVSVNIHNVVPKIANSRDCFRPIAAVRLHHRLLRRGPSDRTFAARAKSVDGRTHTLRTKLAFAAVASMSGSTNRSTNSSFWAILILIAGFPLRKLTRQKICIGSKFLMHSRTPRIRWKAWCVVLQMSCNKLLLLFSTRDVTRGYRCIIQAHYFRKD